MFSPFISVFIITQTAHFKTFNEKRANSNARIKMQTVEEKIVHRDSNIAFGLNCGK